MVANHFQEIMPLLFAAGSYRVKLDFSDLLI
jgi:hypothetical protein